MRRVAAPIVLALAAALLPAGAAQASSKPPVVKIVLKNGLAKASGTKGLKAGWVTFHITTTDGQPHDFQIQRPHSNDPSGSKGVRAPQAIRRSAAAAGPSKAETYREQAAAQKSLDSVLWLGGVQVPAGGVDLTIRLRPGLTWFTDLSGPFVEIKAGPASNSAHPGHADALISEGVDNVISSPATLPRSGTLQLLNTNSRGTQTHELILTRLAHRATKASIEKYFAPNGYTNNSVPFTDYPVTGEFSTLSPGVSSYIKYRNLKPGKYALVDVAFDEKTGHCHAEDGSIKFVTVK